MGGGGGILASRPRWRPRRRAQTRSLRFSFLVSQLTAEHDFRILLARPQFFARSLLSSRQLAEIGAHLNRRQNSARRSQGHVSNSAEQISKAAAQNSQGPQISGFSFQNRGIQKRESRLSFLNSRFSFQFPALGWNLGGRRFPNSRFWIQIQGARPLADLKILHSGFRILDSRFKRPLPDTNDAPRF